MGKRGRPTYKNTFSAQKSCILDTVTGQGKMVLVREKSGKSQGILISRLCGNPGYRPMLSYILGYLCNFITFCLIL